MTGLAMTPKPTLDDSQVQGINALLQEDVAAEVLKHFSTREKLVLASVCRVWRASVAKSWDFVDLHGPDIQDQLAWLAQHVPAHTLKVTSLQACMQMMGLLYC